MPTPDNENTAKLIKLPDTRSAQERREDRFFDLVESMAKDAQENTAALRETVEGMRGDINQLTQTAKESNTLMTNLSTVVNRGLWGVLILVLFVVAAQGFAQSKLNVGLDGIGVELQKSISAEAAVLPNAIEDTASLDALVGEVEGEVGNLKMDLNP